MTTIDNILTQAAINTDFPTDNPDLAVAIVNDVEIISFSPESALLFVTFWEKAPLFSSLMRTHTVVLKTSDGGNNWNLTLDATEGSVVKEEIFFLNERQGWFITQWQIAGAFPTLYKTNDFGDSWQKFPEIHEAIQVKGGIASFVEAQGLRFKSEQEGIVVGKTFNTEGENVQFFFKTTNSGKTWTEIDRIPSEYFTWISQHSHPFNFNHPWTVIAIPSGFSVQKSLGEFSNIYPAAISPS
ncbi:MAG: WD40/YVTN/BNR-like repeat-containing protein [Microcystis panniformis]